MKKEITITVNPEIYDTFLAAVYVYEDTIHYAFEEAMKLYIKKGFEEKQSCTSVSVHPTEDQTSTDKSKVYFAKANRRIPGWAKNPAQYTHKILRAFFDLEKGIGCVKRSDLVSLCKDATNPDFYVPKFQFNFSQMKIDSKKSYGKVFEDDGKLVRIWSEVTETLQQYRDCFYV